MVLVTTNATFRVHDLVKILGPKQTVLPLFHAITGCDQVSFFAGKGKKLCWKAWGRFEDLTEYMRSISCCPSKENVVSSFDQLQRYVVLLYDRTSLSKNVNACRKEMFSKKGRLPESIPPTLDALKLHILRAVYQASYCWAQSLFKEPTLPDPCDWGWTLSGENYETVWTTIPEASKICSELVRCGCKQEKGCRGRCKCVKASLPCTALCKCGADCER